MHGPLAEISTTRQKCRRCAWVGRSRHQNNDGARTYDEAFAAMQRHFTEKADRPAEKRTRVLRQMLGNYFEPAVQGAATLHVEFCTARNSAISFSAETLRAAEQSAGASAIELI